MIQVCTDYYENYYYSHIDNIKSPEQPTNPQEWASVEAHGRNLIKSWLLLPLPDVFPITRSIITNDFIYITALRPSP